MVCVFSVPLILDEVPTIWSTVVSWLKPPYLYVIINGIIITIAASSRFGHKLDDEHTQSEPLVPSRPLQSDLVAVSAQPEFGDVEERQMVVYESEEKVLEVVNGSEIVADDDDDEEDLFVLSRSSWTPSHRKIPQGFKRNFFRERRRNLWFLLDLVTGNQ
ncbi:unnamed protein product [Ilex paraguariensis]|uniref:DUF4408 domain-containing protein n=1 Tax=Ilex paraguariensis TaxID=185542 RepID=A0ABC8RFJ9_9AQUA